MKADDLDHDHDPALGVFFVGPGLSILIWAALILLMLWHH